MPDLLHDRHAPPLTPVDRASADPRDRLRDAHARFQQDGDAAANAFAAAALGCDRLVLAVMRRRLGPTVQLDAVRELLADAVLKLLAGTGRFDPARGTLWTYLCVEVRGDLLNRGRGTTRRSAHERSAGEERARRVAAPASAGYEESEWQTARLAEAQACLKAEADRRYLAAVHAGADDARLADALGIAHLDAAARAAELKRTRDRVRVALKRAGLLQPYADPRP